MKITLQDTTGGKPVVLATLKATKASFYGEDGVLLYYSSGMVSLADRRRLQSYGVECGDFDEREGVWSINVTDCADWELVME